MIKHWIEKLVSKQLKPHSHKNFTTAEFIFAYSIYNTFTQIFIMQEQIMKLLSLVKAKGHWVLSHSSIAAESLSSHWQLSRIALQFCLTILSATGQELSLKNYSISAAFSTITKPDVDTWTGRGTTTHTTLEFHYQNYKVVVSTQLVGTSAVMYIVVLHMHVHVCLVVGWAGKWSVHE